MNDRPAVTRRYAPAPDEMAVVRLRPGEEAIVVTADGERRIRGWGSITAEEIAEVEAEYGAMAEVAVTVPGDWARCGWTVGGWAEGGVRVGLGKSRDDRPVWKEAERLLRTAPAVFVRIAAEPYYSRTRYRSVSVRPADG